MQSVDDIPTHHGQTDGRYNDSQRKTFKLCLYTVSVGVKHNKTNSKQMCTLG